MKNVRMSVKDGVMTLVVDLKKDFGPSKSGKTVIVATTGGNVEVVEGSGTFIGLNVYKKT